MKKTHATLILTIILLMIISFAIWNKSRSLPQRADSPHSPPPSHKTKSSLDRTQSNHSSQSPSKPLISGPAIAPTASSGQSGVATATVGLASPHWSAEVPRNAPVIPPGVEISPPAVVAVIDGKTLRPQFHTSFSERMSIQAGGKAAVSVNWPAEHKTTEVLASTVNDGTVNGEHGVILKTGKNGKIDFTFQAGEHSGPTQVILRSANLAYTVNFLVPTGNPNVDPPTLR